MGSNKQDKKDKQVVSLRSARGGSGFGDGGVSSSISSSTFSFLGFVLSWALISETRGHGQLHVSVFSSAQPGEEFDWVFQVTCPSPVSKNGMC